MIVASLISLLLILVTVVIHYRGLCWLSCFYTSRHHPKNIRLPLVMFGITCVHLVEITIYSGVFFWLHNFTEIGGFTEAFENNVWDYFYFSGVNYTTLGMSEFYPVGHFKVLAFTEALNGFMMLTWSATFFYSLAGQFFRSHGQEKRI